MKLKDLLTQTRTIRRYQQEPVDINQLLDIIDDARRTSCANNMQTLRYIIIHDPQRVKEFQPYVHWAARLKGKGTPKEDQLPPAFIAIIQTKPSVFSDVDCGIVAEVMMQSAFEKGLGSCIFGSHNPSKVADFLGLKEGEIPRLILSFGKSAHTSQIIEDHEDTSYYMDENENFYVPKKSVKELTEIQ